MKIKYIMPVIIAFGSIFTSTYAASALHKKIENIEIYYEDKIEKSNKKYENIIYKKRILLEEKIRYEKEQELIRQKKIKEEQDRKKILAIQKADAKRRIASQNAANERLRQQNKAKQEAEIIAAEKARLKRIAAEKKARAASKKKKKSRRSRAS